MRQQAARLALLVINQIFVANIEHVSAQMFAPMVHQAEVRDLIARDVILRVGERISHAEERLQHRIAACHRMARQVHDLCARQCAGDNSEIEKVERSFVDEHRRARATATHRADVARTKRAHIGLGGRSNALRLVRRSTGSTHHGERQIVEFAAALDAGVATEDAIHERGAAAWQADNENRRLVRETLCVTCEEGAAELAGDIVHGADVRLDVVGQCAPSRRGAAFEMIEGALNFAEVFVFFGERIGERGRRITC